MNTPPTSQPGQRPAFKKDDTVWLNENDWCGTLCPCTILKVYGDGGVSLRDETNGKKRSNHIKNLKPRLLAEDSAAADGKK